MITEDYVSFETAKLLKEKGFDEPCHCFIEEYMADSYKEACEAAIKYCLEHLI